MASPQPEGGWRKRVPNSLQFSDTRKCTPDANLFELRFTAYREGRSIPGVLWIPSTSLGRTPLVLLQHGGSGHKDDASVLELARKLTLNYGIAAAAIDGPIHGERRRHPVDGERLVAEFLSLWSRGIEFGEFVSDWLFVIDALSGLPEIDESRIGWCGVSMGTAFGLPVLANCPRVSAAVLGKWSSNYVNSAHLIQAARQVDCSALFIQHWDDEIFDRQGTQNLFDSLRSSSKRMHVYTGGHSGRTDEELSAYTAHFAQAFGLYPQQTGDLVSATQQ